MSTFASNKDAPIRPADLSTRRPVGDAAWLGISASAWVKTATVTLLFVTLFWPSLRRLWDKTNPFTGEANWAHAFFVPLVGLFTLYVNRETLRSESLQTSPSPLSASHGIILALGIVLQPLMLVLLPMWYTVVLVGMVVAAAELYLGRTAWGGLLTAIFGLLVFAYGIFPGQNDWIKDVGMVITLFGIVTLLCGWRVMKTAWFPIVFLICALPWPGLFYSWLAGPLQSQAARVAVRMLNLFGVESMQSGTKIFVNGQNNIVRTLNVAEACSGLKSLMTFVAIAGAVGFVSIRPLWQKLTILVSAIPIAIFCNTMRITVQGLVDHYYSHQWSEGFAHGFIGLIMMIPAFFLLLLVGWILQNIFIEEVADKSTLRKTYTAANRRPVAATAGVSATSRTAAAPRRFEPLQRGDAATRNPANAAGRSDAPAAASNPPVAESRPAPKPGSDRSKAEGKP